MASKPLRFHSEAEAEYLVSLAWYKGRSLLAATNFETCVVRAIEKIREAPQPGYWRERVVEELP